MDSIHAGGFASICWKLCLDQVGSAKVSIPPRATLGEKGREVVDKELNILPPWRGNSEVGLTVSWLFSCLQQWPLINTPLIGIPSFFPTSSFPHSLIVPSGITTQINSCTQILVSGSGFHGMQTKAPYYLADPLLDKYPRKMLACLHQEIFITVYQYGVW